MKRFPLITIVIPTYNSEKTLERCLSSIFIQSYPREKLEVFVIDNYSEDKTLEIARKYPVKILLSRVKDNLISKMIALRKARGQYFIYFDSDIDLVGENWFEKMLKPFFEDKTTTASFARFLGMPSDPPLSRYLSYDLLQRDPIYEYFSASVESSFRESKVGYILCEYTLDKIPPSGLCLYQRKSLLEIWDIKNEKRFMELDNLVRLVRAGYTRFAFVEGIGLHHPFVANLGQLLKKRLRNISRNYLHQPTPRLYKWFDIKSIDGILKVLTWILYANTIILPVLRGVYKSFKYKDFACMYEPVVVFTETWVIIFGLIRYSFR